MSSTVPDQAHDLNGQELHRIASVYPLPGFVKDASEREVCGDPSLPPHQYADVTNRVYPCHTASATLVSSIFFAEKKASLHPHRAQLISDKLDRAAKFFKVTGYVRRMQEKAAEAMTYSDSDTPDGDFAVVFGTGDDKERHYPMRNAGEVQKAAGWLSQRRDQLPFEIRRKIADKILEKAASYGADIASQRYTLEKLAGIGLCASKDAAKLIRSRIAYLGHTHKPNQLQLEMTKLADLCELSPDEVRHYGMLTKIAGIVDQFDRENGLHRQYDDIIERPEDVLFAVTEKVAADLTDEVVGNAMTGNYYKRADLERLPVNDLADTLGDDFVDAVTSAGAWVDTEKLASIVPTLPLGDAELFDEVVVAAGIEPFATKAAAAGRSISPAEQIALAKKHKPAPGSLWDKIS